MNPPAGRTLLVAGERVVRERPVIFATCGSSHFHFDRMMEALAILPAAELCVQHGPADPPACACAHPYLPFAEVIDQIERADVVVTHGGVGTILCAIQAGHTPVVFPRLKRYAEAVDDHQAELAEALADAGRALVARTAPELVLAVAAVPPRRRATASGSQRLVNAVRTTISASLEVTATYKGVAGAELRRGVGDAQGSTSPARRRMRRAATTDKAPW